MNFLFPIAIRLEQIFINLCIHEPPFVLCAIHYYTRETQIKQYFYDWTYASNTAIHYGRPCRD